jgi:hypothetical protein
MADQGRLLVAGISVEQMMMMMMMMMMIAVGRPIMKAAAQESLVEGVDIPAGIAVPSGNSLHVAYSAEGHQHYTFNGSAWLLYNATAKLYWADAQHNTSEQVGHHFFLVAGGQPTWRVVHDDDDDGEQHVQASQVTAQSLAAVTVDPQSITWNLLQAVSHTGLPYVLFLSTLLFLIFLLGLISPAPRFPPAQPNSCHFLGACFYY